MIVKPNMSAEEIEEQCSHEEEALNYFYDEVMCNYSSEEDAAEALDSYDD